LNITNYAATLSFVIWRLFIYHSIRKETNETSMMHDILYHPIKAMFHRGPKMVSDIFDGLFGSYFNVFHEDLFLFRYKPGFLSIIFILVCSILVIFEKRKSLNSNLESRYFLASKRFLLYMAGFFLLISIISLAPIWFTDKHIKLSDGNSRYGFALIIPGTLFLVFLLSIVVKKNALKYTLWIYLAFCSAYFYRTFLNRSENWEKTRIFYSQIVWRYPKLPTSTLFIFDRMNHISETNSSHFINFAYGYSNSPSNMNYEISEYGYRGRKEDSAVWGRHFNVHEDREIPIAYGSNKCVKFGNQQEDKPFLIDISPTYNSFLLNKQPSTIFGNSGNPAKWPSAIMGKEVSKECYCYYYQKADYYNGLKNYKATDSLFKVLISKRNKIELPKNLSDLMPFVKSSLITKGLDQTVFIFKDFLSQVDIITIHNMSKSFLSAS